MKLRRVEDTGVQRTARGTTPARTYSCGWCSTTPRAGSTRWLRAASPAMHGTGFSARLEELDACGCSPARLYIEAAFAGTCPATVTNRDRRIDSRGPFP